MNTSTLIAIVAALFIGGGAGYLVEGSRNHPAAPSAPAAVTQAPGHAAQTSMVEDLKTKSGDSLDEAFLDGMIVHHQQAIDMATIVLERTMRPEIKQMAQDIISVQTAEIKTMQGWLKAWFGR